MERKFKHKLTNKVIKIGGKTGLSCQTIIGNSTLILGDIIKGDDWEEVIEKDYKILSLWNQGSEYPKLPDGNFGSRCCQISTSVMDQYPIYKIKRLSDGEIFTIGDIINYNKSDNKLFKNCTIKNFTTEKCGEIKIWATSVMGYFELEYIEKIKQPLFTTENGVDIFEGDIYYIVEIFRNYNLITRKCTAKDLKVNGQLNFSTKTKAEEYVLMNKPCLSLNDIIENISKATKIKNVKNTNMIKSLKELVNTKING